MLSKSQAKWFFLVATGGFSFVFLGLTVDTIQQVPERSHAQNLSPSVVRGKEVWEANNCMGCHTLLGEGAYYAPELTKVVERRGVPWIQAFLRDPEAMFPGERKMVKYDFTDAQIDDVIAFLGWVGEIDTNGFPAPPDMASPAPTPPPAAAAAAATRPPTPAVYTSLCVACHAVDGAGGNVGPALNGVASRFDRATLERWLRDPQSVKPGTAMPNLGLTDEVRAELVDWLLTL